MPKVSVIIPAYNSEQFLHETLDCLVRQTLDDFEAVIINDGSTDSTQSVIDSYAEKYPWIRSYTQENAGVSAARNNGLRKARGEYVVFLDADDTYSEQSLEAFYQTGRENDADLVLGRLKTFGDETEGKYNAYADKLAAMKNIDPFDTNLLWNFLVGNKCYKRESLLKSGVVFPSYRYSEEGAFFMSFVYSGAVRICGTTDSCMNYRRHTKKQGLSVSQTVNIGLVKSFSDSLAMIYSGAEKALETARENIDREEYLQEIIYKTAHILIMQFYRLMWHGDDECARYCAEEFKRLRSMMTEKRYNQFKSVESDLHLDTIIGSKEEAAQKPNATFIIKNTKDCGEILESVYEQYCPLFEVIIPKSAAESGKIPPEYLKMQNLVILDDKGFLKNAKKKARSKNRVVFRRAKALDIRVLRLVYKIGLPERIKSVLFPLLFKTVNFVLVKKIIA